MKYYGKIGYAVTRETSPGVWTEEIVERNYYGDVNKIMRRLESGSDRVNDNVTISNTFSIVADAFAYENLFAIRYIEWLGSKWKISTVEVERPRLLINIGGVYNGETP